MEEEHGKKLHTDVELDFNEDDLNNVAISDSHLEDEDKKVSSAKREAKKTAKQLRTPEEKKRALRKKVLIAIGLLVLVIVLLLGIPFTRWPILNAIGFRGNLIITVEDSVSKKPVSGAAVKNGETEVSTDAYGHAVLANARLGKQSLQIQKAGYGETKVTFTNSFGTTRKSASLKVIGIKLDFDFKDWLSGGPVSGATATFGKSNATSDQTGRASLVVLPTDEPKIDVTVAAPGYITKTVSIEVGVVSREVSMVAAPKNYFISKRDGTFNIFSSNLDGSDQQKIIEATGKEDDSLLQFSIYRNNKQAILVSNRDGKVQGGRVVAGIYLVDLEKSTLKKIDEGSDLQLLDWGDSTIAYTKSVTGLNYDDPALNRVMSYNVSTAKLAEVAASNYFTVSIVAQNKLYYMPADAYRAGEIRPLTSYDFTTGARQALLADKQISYVLRTAYATLEAQDSSGASYEIQIANGSTKPTNKRNTSTLSFVASPGNQTAAWTDKRDGQGALLVRNLKSGQESTVLRASGLISPIRYVSENLVVVRVATSQETADYVVHLSSGKIGKIVDVSNIGVSRSSGL